MLMATVGEAARGSSGRRVPGHEKVVEPHLLRTARSSSYMRLLAKRCRLSPSSSSLSFVVLAVWVVAWCCWS